MWIYTTSFSRWLSIYSIILDVIKSRDSKTLLKHEILRLKENSGFFFFITTRPSCYHYPRRRSMILGWRISSIILSEKKSIVAPRRHTWSLHYVEESRGTSYKPSDAEINFKSFFFLLRFPVWILLKIIMSRLTSSFAGFTQRLILPTRFPEITSLPSHIILAADLIWVHLSFPLLFY